MQAMSFISFKTSTKSASGHVITIAPYQNNNKVSKQIPDRKRKKVAITTKTHEE